MRLTKGPATELRADLTKTVILPIAPEVQRLWQAHRKTDHCLAH